MKKHSFLAGMLTMALICGLGFSALAATGQVSFNASALRLNGTQVSAKGENYTLANGQSVPASITYTDEKGGGTTYLPVRRISELLGVETGWDGAAGAVTVGSAPTPTPPPADYSDWSKEDEAAYQEFKGLWRITFSESKDTRFINMYCYEEVAAGESVSEAIRIGAENVDAFLSSHTTEFIEKCCYFFDKELYNQYGISNIMYFYNGTLQGAWGWMDTVSADGWTCGYRKFID